jgi:hypothetical protein
LKPAFPPGLQCLEDNYYLHDAVIQGMGRREGTFVIMLQLDSPPKPLLMLSYDLVEEPIIEPDVLPAEYRSTEDHIDWQYDEIQRASEQPSTWRQSILLSNGWEIALHFRDVRVEEVQALIPSPRVAESRAGNGSVDYGRGGVHGPHALSGSDIAVPGGERGVG